MLHFKHEALRVSRTTPYIFENHFPYPPPSPDKTNDFGFFILSTQKTCLSRGKNYFQKEGGEDFTGK